MVCDHSSDNRIGRPCSGSPICLSRVRLETESDDTESLYVIKERENLHQMSL